MEKHSYKKLTIDFPVDEYVYLKMTCAKLGVSIKDFVTQAVIHSIEDYEDSVDSSTLGLARREVAESGPMSWEELEKRLGWDKL